MTATISHPCFGAAICLLCLVGAPAKIPAMSAPVAGRILWERIDGPFYSCSILWTVTDLTEANLRLLYRSFSQKLKDKNAWTVDVFVDQADAIREEHGKLKTEGDYDWWLRLYNSFGRKPLPMAELFSYKGNGVLRLRDQTGNSKEIVLTGENSLRIRLQSIDFEILKIYYHPLPPQTEPSYGDDAMVSIYARSSAFPGVEVAREFSRLMQSRFQQKRLMVAFRTDAYFITDGAFPIVYRFDPPGRPPSRRVYEASSTMYCFCDIPDIQCR